MNGTTAESAGTTPGALRARNELRNIAIIAHVDHGKTTLVDGMLKQARVFRANQKVAERVLDSNDLERERGITILAKNTAVTIPDPDTGQEVKINIVDTPGHADFGGEVERVLNMVDGALLLVDAFEGPMPQTRFVLKKALAMGHRIIVVINKVDRRYADPDRVLNDTFDLFVELGASEEQADFPVVYAIATEGRAGNTPECGPDLQPLFDAILTSVPAPVVDVNGPLQMLVTTLDYDNYRGVTAVGRLFSGTIRAGQPVARITHDGHVIPAESTYLYVHQGLERVEVDEVAAGEIMAIAGVEGVAIGETIASLENPVALPTIQVEAPTVRMSFSVNNSPFAGREARWSTSRRLRERLFDELKQNVALRVEETESADRFVVSGRGELHLAILIETMRREGYEFMVSRPEVIFRRDEDGQLLEPYEEVYVETTPETVGAVVEMLGQRRGELRMMRNISDDAVLLTYVVPTRGLLGFRYQFMTTTRGMGIMHSLFYNYGPLAGEINGRNQGSLVAWENGVTTSYGLENAEQRGTLFVGPGEEVYAGMVVGRHQRPGDLDVNVCKKKHLTNMRNSIRDIEVRLTPPTRLSLDEFIEYLGPDELLEVTPESLRVRKRILDKRDRERTARQRQNVLDQTS